MIFVRIIKAPFVWIFAAIGLGLLVSAVRHIINHEVFDALWPIVTSVIAVTTADAIAKEPVVRSYITILALDSLCILASFFGIMSHHLLFLFVPILIISIISAIDAARRWHKINYGKMPDPEKS